MGERRSLVEEQILDDDAVHGRQRRLDVGGVGVGLSDVFALDVHAAEFAVERRVEHVGDAQTGLSAQGAAPEILEQVTHGVVGDVAVARELVGERPHVAGALHIVLAAQRVDAHPLTPDVAGEHGQVGHTHDHRRALAVLGHPEAVVDRTVGLGGEKPCGCADLVGGNATDQRHRIGAVLRLTDEFHPLAERLHVAALVDEGLVLQPFGEDHVRHRVDHCHVGARLELQMVVGLDVR